MLLTRKSSSSAPGSASSLVSSLARGVSRAIPTMDRRSPSCAAPAWGSAPASPPRS